MKKPDIPADEDVRLETLRSYDILDTAAEESYDALVRLAAYVTKTPIALISLVESDRQWFKARVGLDAPQTSRDASFCAHAVADRKSLVVRDAALDDRFSDNPLVEGDPKIRFYAGAPLRAPNDQLLGTLCVIDREPRDLSPEQIELLELLAEQAMRLLELRRTAAGWRLDRDEARRFFDTSLDMMCVATFDGYFRDLNPAWTDTLGFSLEELKSRPFPSFVHPEDVAIVQAETDALRNGEHETRGFLARFVTADGRHRWLQFNATADQETRTYTAVARDVSEMLAAQEALAVARDAAEEANRAKSVFLANMSHELRTPLNSVIGFANILLKNKSDNLATKQLNHLERIRRNGSHLLSLLNDILDLSKFEVGAITLVEEEVDLNELIAAVHAAFPEPKPSVALISEVPDGLAPIIGDERRLRQVLTNLIGNAMKFTESGTVITRVSAVDGQAQRIEVIDEGIGIAPENLQRIFEPFEQGDSGTERRFGGTGLGLAITRTLTEAMGFAISVESRLGEGTRFTIELGRPDKANGDQTEEASPVPTRRAQASSPERAPVLIVDDEHESRLLLEAAVSELGFPVIAVDDSTLALAVAESIRPHAVLLDLMMPRLDGFALLDRFRTHPTLNEVPIVVVSIIATESRERLQHALGVLDKPVEVTELATVLRDKIAAHRRVLIIDADASTSDAVAKIADELGVRSVQCETGDAALTEIARGGFDAVVLDIATPGVGESGFLSKLRADPRFSDLPIIITDAPGAAPALLGHAHSVLVHKDGELGKLRAALESVLRNASSTHE